MGEVSVLIIGFGTALLGLIQLYQRSVTKTSSMQEKKNEEILKMGMEAINLRHERDEALATIIETRKAYKELREQYKALAKRHNKLMTILPEILTEEMLDEVKTMYNSDTFLQ